MRHPTLGHLLRWAVVVSAATAAIVMLGGTAVWRLERNRPDSNLRDWGDALWWSVTTITTVGYGEHYPVSVGGRIAAVAVMISGITIIGAVAAMVAFGFAGRLAQRIEQAVSHVESQVEQVEAEVEYVEDQMSAGGHRRRHPPQSGLRALTIGVADADSAASLTWLLARLGWHPAADSGGIAWRQDGLTLRIAVRPWDVPTGIQGRLTFTAGTPETLERIAVEAARHGFRRVVGPAPQPGATRPDRPADGVSAVLRTIRGFEVVLVTS